MADKADPSGGIDHSEEGRRLAAADNGAEPWRAWGPYLAERGWGTVREDYSSDGSAWNFFPHDHARSRVYRWNEDGMAGFCDELQNWCLALALWNGADPIVKERMFGLSGPEGNHGEDVKEYWWYLDGTPTHSWHTWRYHYPQRAFPYEELIAENGRRSRTEPEYELVDTGIFDDGRYWVVTVDYAKAGPHDLLMRLTVENAGPDEAMLHVLPTLWFRNTWAWGPTDHGKPVLREHEGRVVGQHDRAGRLLLMGDGAPELLFCENETNTTRLYGDPDGVRYPKDGINDYLVDNAPTVNPEHEGTKAALHYQVTVPAGGSRVIRVRLVGSGDEGTTRVDLADGFDSVMTARKSEADAFYAALTPARCSQEEADVLRQAFAGLLWSKQFFHFDVERWLDGDPAQPTPPPGRGAIRNGDWRHLNNHEVLLMPDPWEYPWYAAWDLAFHCVTLAHIDPGFAKSQLVLLLREWYLHPNGQIPAYEWNFSDVNPPVHAWAALRVFELDGGTDYGFLSRVFHKLLINFTWWTNNKDHGDNNLFEGGFMGLDNIATIDRSTISPDLGYFEQADSTAWMAMYALDLLAIAVRLALHEAPTKTSPSSSSSTSSRSPMPRTTPASGTRRTRTSTTSYISPTVATYRSRSAPSSGWCRSRRRSMFATGCSSGCRSSPSGPNGSSIPSPGWLLLSTCGSRSVGPTGCSAWCRPSASCGSWGRCSTKGGCCPLTGFARCRRGTVITRLRSQREIWWHTPTTNRPSPRRRCSAGTPTGGGPIWFPLNALLIEALRDYDRFSNGTLLVEYPAGSGVRLSLCEAASDIVRRLVSIFLPGPDGRRPVHGGYDLLATTPRWRDNIPFHEYFHADTGAGLGATHQTGWTALVAHLLLDDARGPKDKPAGPRAQILLPE